MQAVPLPRLVTHTAPAVCQSADLCVNGGRARSTRCSLSRDLDVAHMPVAGIGELTASLGLCASMLLAAHRRMRRSKTLARTKLVGLRYQLGDTDKPQVRVVAQHPDAFPDQSKVDPVARSTDPMLYRSKVDTSTIADSEEP